MPVSGWGEGCRWLHRSLDRLPKLGFPFDKRAVPKDGIYVLFEEGEAEKEAVLDIPKADCDVLPGRPAGSLGWGSFRSDAVGDLQNSL